MLDDFSGEKLGTESGAGVSNDHGFPEEIDMTEAESLGCTYPTPMLVFCVARYLPESRQIAGWEIPI